jgi:hypothetical protein
MYVHETHDKLITICQHHVKAITLAYEPVDFVIGSLYLFVFQTTVIGHNRVELHCLSWIIILFVGKEGRSTPQ